MPQVATINRHSERAVPDEAAAILAKGLVAHVGYNVDGQPNVIPFTYHYDPAQPERIYLHGSPESGSLTTIADGAAVCINVLILDGLVYSRTAPNHSMNYRSVVCYGRAREITDVAEKQRIFTAMIGRYFAGRSAGQDYRAAPIDELRSTIMLEVTIERWGAKARRGGPIGPKDADPTALGTNGVVPVEPTPIIEE